jgi:hypothetical protein
MFLNSRKVHLISGKAWFPMHYLSHTQSQYLCVETQNESKSWYLRNVIINVAFLFRFYAAGFILYFPSDDPYWTWSPTHGHLLLITVIFIWFVLLICIFLFIQSSIVWSVLKRRYSDNDDNDSQIELEEQYN